MERRTKSALTAATAHLARAIVGLAFVIAGTTKAIHPGTFTADIWSYHVVPEWSAVWIAAFLPYLEIAVGTALIIGRQRDGARALALVLLFVFLGALAISWTRGLDIACGCFGAGAGEPANYPWLILRDMLLIGCIAIDLLASRAIARLLPRS